MAGANTRTKSNMGSDSLNSESPSINAARPTLARCSFSMHLSRSREKSLAPAISALVRAGNSSLMLVPPVCDEERRTDLVFAISGAARGGAWGFRLRAIDRMVSNVRQQRKAICLGAPESIKSVILYLILAALLKGTTLGGLTMAGSWALNVIRLAISNECASRRWP
jgi:hypothetical protein